MARHKQKDDEAGAEGCGILNTRKRMWKGPDGTIVTKKPTLAKDNQKPQSPPQENDDTLQALADFALFANHEHNTPISPPVSHDPSLSNSLDDRDSGIASGYPPTTLVPNTLPVQTFSPTDQRFWSTNLNQTEPDPFVPTAFDDAPFDEIFNPDTASSFNNPFTTMSNYNWLFDMDLAQVPQVQQSAAVHDTFPNFSFPNHNASQSSHAFGLHLDHLTFDKSLSTGAEFGSNPSHRTDSVVHHSPTAPMIAAHIGEEQPPESKTPAHLSLPSIANTGQPMRHHYEAHMSTLLPDIERPMSMLQPSRSLPIIDELARQQILDLIDITQPTAPDGSIVMRDHPLLSLSCLQTYCDLFWTRFNTTYPLLHMSTFDPSHVDTLLLTTLLLLGATYGEKDAHQLAVCIHDVLRPQIFASAGFSAKPDLWVLQTILLVECFGKSRAGQKQHDMSHLFHGLLINLIRRSECQSIRPPTVEEATDDLEDDWRIWVDAEQKKRLAYLCFMWDTQHAVLFCQSLCMSAFELRSNLPCNQSLWEADSAESWHQLRQKQPPPPLFLSCLKMYLHPNATPVPKTLNNLSRSLLLHGLMSVAWDMQRRDQTSLGDPIAASPLGNWQSRLAASYTAWYADYESFCNTYNTRVPSHQHFLANEFQVIRSATLAMYHSAHILLHTPFLDLQIYAGARHILGRPVARPDYVRSQRIVKKWVAENINEAGKAVWHAAALVSQGIDVLDGELDVGAGRLWHHPWAVYLGTLVVWGVWYARPIPPATAGQGELLPFSLHDEEDEIIWDPSSEMKSLLESINRAEPEMLLQIGYKDGISGAAGKRGTNGLAACVSRCLSKVRWAVVHDGMMVLRGLVQWRLVGGSGGGMFV
ncbi:fungal-specific transcription factor domain-containing protein [Boeremia exigua]|uniref:fungal-specific transcription factor domain-containing protein n=1 Tax=Boeremia exigua TaxID=749465 RepID=UPI001E8E8751|nr:fungal-specific transcription factor domain-containing protein [Boeremia exigua]KAH6638408.1 fungal-specific transcription factor domain-containing protein [Boeremia exigua]